MIQDKTHATGGNIPDTESDHNLDRVRTSSWQTPGLVSPMRSGEAGEAVGHLDTQHALDGGGAS
jgi:hypothetical protein